MCRRHAEGVGCAGAEGDEEDGDAELSWFLQGRRCFENLREPKKEGGWNVYRQTLAEEIEKGFDCRMEI